MSGGDLARPPDRRPAPRRHEHPLERPRVSFVEIRLFLALAIFFTAAGVVYYVWSDEWFGTVLFILSGVVGAIVGGYLFLQARLEASLAPNEEGRPSVGAVPVEEEYLPHASPWPLELGFGGSVALVGLVLGRWVFLAGAAACAHALWGWIAQSRRRG
jgi:hypothetical protein